MLNTRTKLFLACAWTLLVIVLSIINIGEVGNEIQIPYKDKIVHFLFYFIFTILWFSYLNSTKPNSKNIWLVLTTAILFGTAIEIYQATFTLSRHSDVADVLANSLGAILGVITSIIGFKFKNKNKKNLA